MAAVVKQAGTIDSSFNVIGYGDVQKPLTELTVAELLQPITTAMRTHFLTTRAAAPPMIRQGSGVILPFGGNGPQTLPGLGGYRRLVGGAGHRHPGPGQVAAGPGPLKLVGADAGVGAAARRDRVMVDEGAPGAGGRRRGTAYALAAGLR